MYTIKKFISVILFKIKKKITKGFNIYFMKKVGTINNHNNKNY